MQEFGTSLMKKNQELEENCFILAETKLKNDQKNLFQQ